MFGCVGRRVGRYGRSGLEDGMIPLRLEALIA